MLSYQHGYHAGMHADCHKHLVLALILQRLQDKDTPYCYIDTHAGRGRYDLQSFEANKVGEYQAGIAKLWRHQDWPQRALPYRDIIAALNPDQQLRFYPGSPWVAAAMMRPQDRCECYDLHPQEFASLAQNFAGTRNVLTAQRDGWDVLQLPPPRENRGLVHIDPSYELKEDYALMPARLAAALKLWRNGMFAIWYPLLQDQRHTTMLDGFVQAGLRKILLSEIVFSDPVLPGIHGSGLLVINPPWKLPDDLANIMPWLNAALGRTHEMRWLVPE